MVTEFRTYVGQPGSLAYDGYAGFTIGQRYELRIERRKDGLVAVMAQQLPDRRPLLVSEAQFLRWWIE